MEDTENLQWCNIKINKIQKKFGINLNWKWNIKLNNFILKREITEHGY